MPSSNVLVLSFSFLIFSSLLSFVGLFTYFFPSQAACILWAEKEVGSVLFSLFVCYYYYYYHCQLMSASSFSFRPIRK